MLHRWIREPFNSLSHLVAAAVALAGMFFLAYLSRSDLARQGSLLIYGASLVLMLSASATYHLVIGSPKTIKVFQKIDHSAIFALIAGTYTPICYNLFSGFWRWGLIATVWTLALVGIISKILISNPPRWFHTGTYLLLGWVGLFAIKEMLAVLPVAALVWLLLGGAAFSLGAVIYMTKIFDFKPGVFGFHELWHIFVILGCLCHFILIWRFVAI